MDYREQYKIWVQSEALSQAEKDELLAISDQKEIESRFFAPLEFGTAGLRGIIGVGTHRMNIYTVRQATQGLADVICAAGSDAKNRGAAVCYDCRIMSREFAREAACVLAGNGIRVRLFEDMRPTPELSFAVRHYNCIAGINITASHNPKEYNGYKVYWQDGAQLPPAEAAAVAERMKNCDIFCGARLADYDKSIETGMITIIGAETDDAFLAEIQKTAINPDNSIKMGSTLKIVYTPFHGTGFKLVPEILRRTGFRNILCVESQMITDGTFPTVKSPNPEEQAGFYLAVELAEKNNADLIIGTDPDADRIGVMARCKDGKYHAFTGNQIGALLANYIITAAEQRGELASNAAVIKTIVTTELTRAICGKHGVACFDTFTGFKFMAEKIKQFEKDGSFKYILAYEESYGYLVGNHARDKDAVTASMLVAEMAAYYAEKNMTLFDALDSLYSEYGFYTEKTISLIMPGVDGIHKMARLMELLRTEPLKKIGGFDVCEMRDYSSGKRFDNSGALIGDTDISGSNVLYYKLSDGSSFIIRPSGTEPKIKIYILVKGASRLESEEKTERLECAANEISAKV